MATLLAAPKTETKKLKIGRRSFLLTATGGLSLGFFLPEVSKVAEAQGPVAATVNAWLTVQTDETVVLTVGASEMGQGSFSALAQILAEDLMVDYAKVKTVQGKPTLLNPAPVGTSINTVGSSVTRTNYWKMRDAGAAARELLVQAYMNQKGDQTRSNYSVALGVVKHTPSGTTATYGQLAAAAALIANPPTTAPLVPDSEFRLIGKTQARQDIPFKVDGSAKYGIDIRLNGMVYAIIKHGPAFGATLASTPRVPSGMLAVVPTKVWAGTGRGTEVTDAVNAVAVVGPDTWTTWRAARGLSVSWNIPANAASLTSANFVTQAQALAASAPAYVAGGLNPPGTLYTVEGNAPTADASITGAAKLVDQTYTLPYVSHACMEVLNCTVNYVAGVSCEIWAPTQSGKPSCSLPRRSPDSPPTRSLSIPPTSAAVSAEKRRQISSVRQSRWRWPSTSR